MPIERNGPKGISDLIVRLLDSIGKLKCDFKKFKKSAIKAKPAPIQKAKITAEIPPEIPSQKPITTIYLTSPKPSQRPLEIKKMRRKGSVTTTPEVRDTRYEVRGSEL